MIIVDDHAHIEEKWILKAYKSMNGFISTQESSNVKYIIAQSLNVETAKEVLELSKKYKIILPALGIYPDENLNETLIEQEFSWIKQNIKSAVAIGEVGLDYSYENFDKNLQLKLFKEFITLSKSTNIPLIIHSRKAERDVIEILIENDVKKAVLHCFSGNKKLIKKAQEKGFYFSIPTNIVKSQHFQMIVEMIDISRILTETDAPFLSPYNNDEPNEPKNIIESLKVISKIKKMTIEETANAIFQNFQRLYL